MQFEPGDIHVVNRRRGIQGHKLHSQPLRVVGLNARGRCGFVKPLQTLVAERLDHVGIVARCAQRNTCRLASKHGDVRVQKLLIHGARSAQLQSKRIAKRKPDTLTRLQRWALDLEQRVGHNKATAALANKIARIAWATWHHDRTFSGSFADASHLPLHGLRRDNNSHDEQERPAGDKVDTKAQEHFGASAASPEGTRRMDAPRNKSEP